MQSTNLGFVFGLCLLTLSVPLDYNAQKPFISNQDENRETTSLCSGTIPHPKKAEHPHIPDGIPILADFDQMDRILREQVRGYRRITAKNVLDHQTRRLLHDLICTYPGIDLTGLVSFSGVKESTLRYHLDRMTDEHLISILTVGKSFHFFENHNRFIAEEQQFLSRFSSGLSGRILQTTRSHPGITRRELATFLGIASPTVTRAVMDLASEGYLYLEKDGKYTRHYFPGQFLSLIHRVILS